MCIFIGGPLVIVISTRCFTRGLELIIFLFYPSFCIRETFLHPSLDSLNCFVWFTQESQVRYSTLFPFSKERGCFLHHATERGLSCYFFFFQYHCVLMGSSRFNVSQPTWCFHTLITPLLAVGEFFFFF